MRNQTRVLKELLKGRTKQTPEEISKNVELTKQQVYRALIDLKNRRLIIKTYEKRKTGYKSPPGDNLYVELNYKVLNRIRTIIENDK